jgi:hypothetical protein
MTHTPFARRLFTLLALATFAASAADAASPTRRVRHEPGLLKAVAARPVPGKAEAKAPAPAPQRAAVSHGNQDGDRFLYDSCGCSGGQ